MQHTFLWAQGVSKGNIWHVVHGNKSTSCLSCVLKQKSWPNRLLLLEERSQTFDKKWQNWTLNLWIPMIATLHKGPLLTSLVKESLVEVLKREKQMHEEDTKKMLSTMQLFLLSFFVNLSRHDLFSSCTRSALAMVSQHAEHLVTNANGCNKNHIFMNATPWFAYNWLCTEHPHAGLTRSWAKTRFSQKTHFSACGTSHATSPVNCSSKEACSEEQRKTIVSKRWCMQRNGYVFWPLHPEHDFGFATMTSLQAKSQQTVQQSQQIVQLARRFFTQKHRSTQWREDCTEDLELNLSQTSHSV